MTDTHVPLMHRLYRWVGEKARGPYGLVVLALVSFTESSFFLVPPDVVIVALILSGINRWKYIALLTTITSVLGGLLGYGIGYGLYETIGVRLVEAYHLHEEVKTIGSLFEEYGFLSIFLAAFTPIPYKAFTISAGLFSMNIFLFLLASILGRGARFYAVSYITYRFGPTVLHKAERYLFASTIILLLILLLALVVLF